MGTLTDVGSFLATAFDALRGIDVNRLGFWHADDARLIALGIVAVVLAMLVIRSTVRRRTAHQRVGVPAIVASLEPRSWSFIRHAPLVLFVAGLPWVVFAVSDPYSALTERVETFPGRRILLMVDASSSMTRPFRAPGLTARGGSGSQAAFFTTVGAAERFVQARTDGPYRDLMAVVEFGDQAYVVTPFTTDYDNVRLSLSLIGDFTEYMRFPDQGTVLTRAVEQGVELFKAFDFLDASGNLMVLLSDGEDVTVIRQGVPVADVVKSATAAEIPIYFIRTRFGQALGAVVSDAEWKTAVESTGGRFYAGSDEASILRAIDDINTQAVGEIQVNQYVSQRAAFEPFALGAASLWSLAIALSLTVPYFRRFP